MNLSIAIICTSPGFGGLEMNTLKLAKWLSAKNWNVQLLTNEKSNITQEGIKNQLSVTTIQSLHAKKNAAFVLKRWLQNHPADILFTPYNKDLAPLAFYKMLFRRKATLVYQQHMKVGIPKRDLIHTLRYRTIDLWLSPLQYLKEETLQLTKLKAEKIAVIPLGIEPKKFSIPLNQEAARLELGLPQHAFIIGIAGRIDPKKGQDFLVEMMPRILKEIHSALLVIMGDVTAHEGNHFLQLLLQKIKESGLQDKIILLPFKKEVVHFYKAIDVLAVPSEGETYGMVTLEAMASGTPVIGANKDGTKEILQKGALGWLYNSGDENAFLSQLLEIASGENGSEKTNAAKAEINTHYAASRTFEETEEALKALISKQRF